MVSLGFGLGYATLDSTYSKGLNETQHSFAKKCVQPKRRMGLVKYCQDRVAKDEGHECVITLNAVFDVDGWEELEVLV